MCCSGFTSLWFGSLLPWCLPFSGPVCPNTHAKAFSYKLVYIHTSKPISIYLYRYIYIYRYLDIWYFCVYRNAWVLSALSLPTFPLLWREAKGRGTTPSSPAPNQGCLPSFPSLCGSQAKAQLPTWGSDFAVMASGSLAHSTDICVGSSAVAPGAVNGLSWW